MLVLASNVFEHIDGCVYYKTYLIESTDTLHVFSILKIRVKYITASLLYLAHMVGHFLTATISH
jgi:hypothetical protein